MSRRVLYLDCAGGVAGDMLVCALSEALGSVDLIDELPKMLGFPDVSLEWLESRPGGFAARRLKVHFEPSAHPHHRKLSDVHAIIDRTEVTPAVASMAKKVFLRLAEAEGVVHGESAADVEFHEVGAVDALVDVVGA